MSKNLIVCSDGTGNAGGKGRGTNVWRIYQAIDHRPHAPAPHQFAYYDDGVGSQDWKLARIIGGAFGWGISANLRILYGFLMRHYQPGDKIFLFGFSRGAFTVRVLSNMIRYCGIAGCDGLSPRKINARAAEALAAYKGRRLDQPGGGPALQQFKAVHGQLNGPTGPDLPAPSKDIPIHFIGVWDTVDAVGLPVDEMTDGLQHWFPLRFHERWNPTWQQYERENDLHEGVRHAFHALSIDDERLSFHPVLWNESLAVAGQTVRQVWFAGVHANVGGGYPKDQLSLIPLNWMMQHAHQCGLQFLDGHWQAYRQEADEDGEIYNSRAGFASYYRYSPRKIQTLSRAAGIPRPTIHASVLERIHNGTDDYAPGQIPAQYHIEDPCAAQPETNPAGRVRQLGIVQDVVWWRRVIYYLMVAWSIALVIFCWWNKSTQSPDPSLEDWNVVSRCLHLVINPLLNVVEFLMPSYFEPGVIALRHFPGVSLGFIAALVAILLCSQGCLNRGRDMCVRAWRISMPSGNVQQPALRDRTWWIKLAHAIRYNAFANWLSDRAIHLIPIATRYGTYLVIIGLLARWLVPPISLALNPKERRAQKLLSSEPVKLAFDSRFSLQPTPVILVEGEKYRITVVDHSPWLDWDHPASPDGVEETSLTMHMTGWLLLRSPQQPWFRLLGSLYEDGADPFPIGHAATFRAPKTGRLHLFVNDVCGFYWNNVGTAELRIECLTAVRPPAPSGPDDVP